MASIRLLIIPLVFSACASTGAVSQARRSSLCGRVVAVSCETPSSPVTLLFTLPSRSLQWWIVIPPELVKGQQRDNRRLEPPATSACARIRTSSRRGSVAMRYAV